MFFKNVYLMVKDLKSYSTDIDIITYHSLPQNIRVNTKTFFKIRGYLPSITPE